MVQNEVSSSRPSGYGVGICILALGTAFFILGFASPYWHFSRGKDGSVLVHGLWTTCEERSATLSNCDDRILVVHDWFRMVQTLQCLACLLLVMACVLAVVANFRHSLCCRRMLDFTVGFGAAVAVLATLGYLLFTLTPPDDESPDIMRFNWGFGCNAAGSLLCALGAILYATCRALPPDGPEDPAKGEKKAGKSNMRNESEEEMESNYGEYIIPELY